MDEQLDRTSIETIVDHPSVSMQADPDDVADFLSTLHRRLQALASELQGRGGGPGGEDGGDGSDGEALPDGACAMCERVMPLTRHHLIPRVGG